MYKILDSASIEWNSYVEKLPLEKRDIYLTREYIELYEANGDGIARLFIYEESNNLAIYPFLIRLIEGYELDKHYYDIETAYGYGGPVVINELDDKFIKRFENNFLNYCKEENIIAEFIRFSPHLNNEKIFEENIVLLKNRLTIGLNLRKSIEDIWNYDLKGTARTRVRKGEKSGLYIDTEKDYKQFKILYEETMKKVSADEYYYFAERYYTLMEKNENFMMINVKLNENTIASGIFMKYGEYFHYHLGCSKKEYLELAPNNFLFWEAIKYANENKYKLIHFGGGRTSLKEDTLFKFKSTFSKDTLNFYIGKRVHNKKIYDYLIEEWQKKAKINSEILLKYRQI